VANYSQLALPKSLEQLRSKGARGARCEAGDDTGETEKDQGCEEN